MTGADHLSKHLQLLFPVRALHFYLEKSQSICKEDVSQLFVFGAKIFQSLNRISLIGFWTLFIKHIVMLVWLLLWVFMNI